jgi:cytidine deaminase
MDQTAELKNLVELAAKAKENSYSPYSKFRVGCALKTKSGKIFTGI